MSETVVKEPRGTQLGGRHLSICYRTEVRLLKWKVIIITPTFDGHF